jgi:hypothetical protein
VAELGAEVFVTLSDNIGQPKYTGGDAFLVVPIVTAAPAGRCVATLSSLSR